MEIDPEIYKILNGFLNKKLWAVLTKPNAPFAEMSLHFKAHLEHQVALEKQGRLFAAGPCKNPGDMEPSFGLIILRATTEQEARSIADSDPMHIHGVRSYELYEWTLNEGQFQIKLNLSDQTCSLD